MNDGKRGRVMQNRAPVQMYYSGGMNIFRGVMQEANVREKCTANINFDVVFN